MATITEKIVSNTYQDYIIPYNRPSDFDILRDFGPQYLDRRYMAIRSENDPPDFPFNDGRVPFNPNLFLPKLFTPLSTVSLENSGIIQAQTYPNLNLSGRGVLIGFVDTGIDYTHPAFLTSDGKTRIVSIWDQSIQTGAADNPFQYGTIYTAEQIQEALASERPLDTVPSVDENGHGTFLAGVAAGSPDPARDFIGAAYDAKICMVKLKPAKEHLRDYYFADPNATLYQENDIMTGINFLLDQAQQLRLPLIVCVGLGTNQGDHAGNSPLSQMISHLSYITFTSFAIAGGNEGGRSHHYFNTLLSGDDQIEILVPENSEGFVAELWGSATELLSVGLQSPLGTQIATIAARPGKTEEISLLLERTRITISYAIVSESGGDQLILFRFQNPVPGNWVIRVYGRNEQSSFFHMWLPITGMLAQDITFLNPNPNTTLTVPADAEDGISTSTYNAYNQSLYIHSGRGYTRTGDIKPTLASPGVNVTGPNLRKGYTNQTGSSASAALLAGSAALLQQWSMGYPIPQLLNSHNITSYLVRGAVRDPGLNYPNREWGYGKLNVFGIFNSLMA